MPVLAAEESETKAAPSVQFDGEGMRGYFSGALARTFHYHKSMIPFVSEALENASDSAGKAYYRITQLEVAGKDVGRLDGALANYEML
jgi:hypothetical protein